VTHMAMLKILSGIVKDGVVVPEHGDTLPEGAHVGIVLHENGESLLLAPEFAEWDAAGSDAWKMIDAWEKEEGVEPW